MGLRPSLSDLLADRDNGNRCRTGQDRRRSVGAPAFQTHDLPGLWRLQAQLARHHIDALRIAQRCLFEPQRMFISSMLVALRSSSIRLPVLDGLEMLPRVASSSAETGSKERCRTASSLGSRRGSSTFTRRELSMDLEK